MWDTELEYSQNGHCFKHDLIKKSAPLFKIVWCFGGTGTLSDLSKVKKKKKYRLIVLFEWHWDMLKGLSQIWLFYNTLNIKIYLIGLGIATSLVIRFDSYLYSFDSI